MLPRFFIPATEDRLAFLETVRNNSLYTHATCQRTRDCAWAEFHGLGTDAGCAPCRREPGARPGSLRYSVVSGETNDDREHREEATGFWGVEWNEKAPEARNARARRWSANDCGARGWSERTGSADRPRHDGRKSRPRPPDCARVTEFDRRPTEASGRPQPGRATAGDRRTDPQLHEWCAWSFAGGRCKPRPHPGREGIFALGRSAEALGAGGR